MAEKKALVDSTGRISEIGAEDRLEGVAYGVPVSIATSDTFYVPTNTQVLFALPITVDGTIVIDGELVGVT